MCDEVAWFSRTLEALGNRFGDADWYLVCAAGDEHRFDDRHDLDSCPECGGELYVHAPAGESLAIRWQLAISRFLPHRLYCYPEKGAPYRIWRWRRREFLRRPWVGLAAEFGIDED